MTFPRVIFEDPTRRVRIVQRYVMNEARPADCLTLEQRSEDAMKGAIWTPVGRGYVSGLDSNSVEGLLAAEIAKRAIAQIEADERRSKEIEDRLAGPQIGPSPTEQWKDPS